MRGVTWLLLILLALVPATAHALGELITDVRVQNYVRTDEETIRAIVGVSPGDTLETDTLEVVRERLNGSGLFADVNVYWEPYRDGVRVNIVVTEKFPWAPIPAFSYSPGNISGGLLVGHGNLFGRGKRGLIGARYSTVDSGALVAYEDPAIFGTWFYGSIRGKFQDQVIPEFGNASGLPPLWLRQSSLRAFGSEATLGIAWFRKVRTSVGWNIEKVGYRASEASRESPIALGNPLVETDAARGGRRGLGMANVTFDFRAREHAVIYGSALAFGLALSRPGFGSDEHLRYWKGGAAFQHGVRFFRRHNLLIDVEANIAHLPPLWDENYAGGSNLRGFVYRQFAGDTHLGTRVEYHYPLFSIMKLDVRGLFFGDGAAVWYRDMPPIEGDVYARRNDGRQFLPPEFLKGGFDPSRDLHVGAGAGIRFYLRSVAVPLVGVDFGHGIGTGTVRMVLVLGV